MEGTHEGPLLSLRKEQENGDEGNHIQPSVEPEGSLWRECIEHVREGQAEDSCPEVVGCDRP